MSNLLYNWLRNEGPRDLYRLPCVVRIVKSRRLWIVGTWFVSLGGGLAGKGSCQNSGVGIVSIKPSDSTATVSVCLQKCLYSRFKNVTSKSCSWMDGQVRISCQMHFACTKLYNCHCVPLCQLLMTYVTAAPIFWFKAVLRLKTPFSIWM
jgi:hypothetical protein